MTSQQQPVRVIGSVFQGAGMEGDFGWMIEQPEYADALFVFNDNEEQFLEHQRDPASSLGCAAGGGNAIIRPYQCKEPARSTGIPTGSNGKGYDRMTADVRGTIELAFYVIEALIATGQYRRIIYSAANDAGELGTGIFQVGNDVKAYIVGKLKALQVGMA